MYKSILSKLISISSLVLITAFSKQKKIEILRINYSQKINGYQVHIDFTPRKVNYEKYIIGPGIIYFKHVKTKAKFDIKNPMMGFPTGVLPIQLSKNKKWIVSVKSSYIKLKYKENYCTKGIYKLGNIGTNEVPFCFQDLNLDSIKELLIPQLNMGQRGITSFKSYELKNGVITNKKYSFTKQKPFTELDEMSKINSDKKIITIHGSNGACKCTDKIYIYNPISKDTPFVYSYLTKEVALNRSTGKCITKNLKINRNRMITY